jgi:GNAT superfamily N-acetyltransferase
MHHEWRRGEFTISTDRARLDLSVIHHYLSQTSYWAQGRSRERVAASIAASTPFGLYHGERQIGFARVLSDRVTLSFLADVFVLPDYRGRGLGTWLCEVATSLPELATARRWLLGTRDAHGLYRKLGFGEPAPGILMERLDPDSDHRPISHHGSGHD